MASHERDSGYRTGGIIDGTIPRPFQLRHETAEHFNQINRNIPTKVIVEFIDRTVVFTNIRELITYSHFDPDMIEFRVKARHSMEELKTKPPVQPTPVARQLPRGRKVKM